MFKFLHICFCFWVLAIAGNSAVLGGPNRNALVALDCNAYTPAIDSLCAGADSRGDVIAALWVRDVQSLDGIVATIAFDKEKLSFVYVSTVSPINSSASFMESNGGTLGAVLAKPAGATVDCAVSISGSDTLHAVWGEGVAVWLVFKRIKNGQCSLKILEAACIDPKLSEDRIIPVR